MGRILIILLPFLLIACSGEATISLPQPIEVELSEAPKRIYAGDKAVISFEVKGEGKPYLKIDQSMGPVILYPQTSGANLEFQLQPENTRQSGTYTWQLVYSEEILQKGTIEVLPKVDEVTKIETYFGPRSIRAGGNDFSMLFVVPTDIYDNPLPDGTQVDINRQMDNVHDSVGIAIKNGYIWHNLYSSDTTGRMLVSAGVGEVSGKELTSMITPSNSVNFSIDYTRVHEYADGNQVVEFFTDIIKDRFGNVVSDGTLVNFRVTDQKAARLQTAGTTLAGVATGRLLHPTEASKWSVTAYVTGESKSNDIELSFRTAVEDYDVQFSEDNRAVQIGPMHGFMEQLTPDGLLITLRLYDEQGKLIDTKKTNSSKGVGAFELQERFYKNGKYKITITTAGINKEFQVALGNDELE
ncbi:MAG: hypothetical protein CML04_09315 [Pseudozobellia sp.]|nr:hypothetical protein [Pseudozobellia sp.]MBG49867.1 hypothetical protein [Pseudozobellia sp.]